MNEQTPTPGAPVPTPSAPVPNAGAGSVPLPGKRGRGRPPLGLSKPPAGPADARSKPAEAIVVPLWTPENARPIGQLPFLVAGIATGFDGWALDSKEAEAIAGPLAQVLNALIPTGGKYAAVVALSSTLLVVGGMKAKMYREWLAVQRKKVEAEKKAAPLT